MAAEALTVAALVLAVMPGGSAFDGTWLTDLGASRERRAPETYVLRAGVFARGAGPGAPVVRADGRFHAVPGGRYVDAIAATDRGRGRLHEVDRLVGRTVYVIDYRVSSDGGALTVKTVDLSKPDGKPPAYVARYRRVGRRAATGAALTGRWRQVAIAATRASLTDVVRLAHGRLSVRAPSGYGYDAIVGGPPVPVSGDIGTIAVSMPDDRTIVARSAVDGKQTVTATWRLLPGDRVIRVTARLAGAASGSTWLMRRQ